MKRSIARSSGTSITKTRRRITDYGGSGTWGGDHDQYSNLHQVYRGRYDRFEKYRQYDWMDQDSDISRALDLIAEHCTERDSEGRRFQIGWETEEPTAELSEVLKHHMDQWSRINKFDKHLFKIVRNTLKYGDWFVFRNPYTFELYDIHPSDVMSAIVDAETLDILGWVIRDFRWNIEDLEVNVDLETKEFNSKYSNMSAPGAGSAAGQNTRAIPAVHIHQFSMNEGKIASSSLRQNNNVSRTNQWPFGNSWLEQALKTFRQREMIEDAALIHRVQRAPTRNVWYIDTGKTRSDRAKYIVSEFKNDLNQKRVPNFTAGRDYRSVDSVYNPISQLEDYYIPMSMDQRGSKVETLEGTPWNEIPELEYFKEKMMQAMRVPYAWLLPAGKGGITPSDGRQGTATQEEIEFSRFCSRVHTFLIDEFDHEFKLYCRWRDVNANWGDFTLQFIPPTDYEDSKNRARLRDSMEVFSTMVGFPFISKRYAMKHALGFSDDQITENERMVDEENNRKEATTNFDSMGMGGGMPMGDMGDGAMPLDPGMTGGIGDAMAGGMDAPGGDMGGGDMGMGGMGGMGGGGFGESKQPNGRRNLAEQGDEFPLPKKKQDYSDVRRTPDDKQKTTDDPIKGKPVATLKLIQRIRHAHFAKRVDHQKRMKMLNRIYGAGSEPEGPGGLGSF